MMVSESACGIHGRNGCESQLHHDLTGFVRSGCDYRTIPRCSSKCSSTVQQYSRSNSLGRFILAKKPRYRTEPQRLQSYSRHHGVDSIASTYCTCAYECCSTLTLTVSGTRVMFSHSTKLTWTNCQCLWPHSLCAQTCSKFTPQLAL